MAEATPTEQDNSLETQSPSLDGPAAALPITTGIVLYGSSVPGSVQVEKHIERARFLLESKKLPFTFVDCSRSPVDKEYLAKTSTHQPPYALPQLFKDGAFLGTFPDLEEANEVGEIRQFLGLPVPETES